MVFFCTCKCIIIGQLRRFCTLMSFSSKDAMTLEEVLCVSRWKMFCLSLCVKLRMPCISSKWRRRKGTRCGCLVVHVNLVLSRPPWLILLLKDLQQRCVCSLESPFHVLVPSVFVKGPTWQSSRWVTLSLHISLIWDFVYLLLGANEVRGKVEVCYCSELLLQLFIYSMVFVLCQKLWMTDGTSSLGANLMSSGCRRGCSWPDFHVEHCADFTSTHRKERLRQSTCKAKANCQQAWPHNPREIHKRIWWRRLRCDH